MRDFMKPIREALKGAIAVVDEEEDESTAEKVADRLRTMLWPERHIEMKRQRAIHQVQEEARSNVRDA